MHEGAEVHYLTKKSFKGIIEPNPYITKIYTIEKSTNEVIEDLKAEMYDYVIDLHRNLRSTRVKHALKALSFSFRKHNLEKWLLVNFGINRMPKVHIVDRYMETLKAFGINNDEAGLDYFFPDGFSFPERDLPDSHRNGFIALVIGAAHWRKKPNVHQYVHMCRNLNYPIVLLGGSAEKQEGAEISARTEGYVWNTAGLYDLNGSAWLIKQSQLVITPDTGLMHIAAALHKPIISIWAATVPAFGMSPYHNEALNAMIEASHLKKRPCSKLGTSCKYIKCRCVDELPLGDAVSIAKSELGIS